MKTPELKPCPFCGKSNPACRSDMVLEYNTLYCADYVICTNCGCRTSSYIDGGIYSASRAWNRRDGDAQAD